MKLVMKKAEHQGNAGQRQEKKSEQNNHDPRHHTLSKICPYGAHLLVEKGRVC